MWNFFFKDTPWETYQFHRRKAKTADTSHKATPRQTAYNTPATMTRHQIARLAKNPTLKGQDTKHQTSRPRHDQSDHCSRPPLQDFLDQRTFPHMPRGSRQVEGNIQPVLGKPTTMEHRPWCTLHPWSLRPRWHPTPGITSSPIHAEESTHLW
jgi:hypothetical protein